MISWSRKVERASVRLFMKKTAPNTPLASGIIHIRPAFCR
jgi:hypothetical protein